MRILREAGVEDGVGNLVGDLVRVALGNGFGSGNEILIRQVLLGSKMILLLVNKKYVSIFSIANYNEFVGEPEFWHGAGMF